MDKDSKVAKEQALKFDAEREAYLESFGDLERDALALQQRRSELMQSWGHVFLLQNKISDAKVMLQEERLCRHNQKVEIAALRVVQKQNQLRLQQLLELTRPYLEKKSGSSKEKTLPDDLFSSFAELPSHSDLEIWKAEARRLRQEVQWFDQSYHQRISQIRARRADTVSSHRKQVAEITQDVKNLNDALCSKEQLLQSITLEYLSLRHTALLAHRTALNLSEQVARQKANLKQQVERVHQQQIEKVLEEQQSFGKRAETLEEDIHSEIHHRLQEITMIGSQYDYLESAYTQRIQSVSTKHNAVKKKFQIIKRRFSLEIEGFSNELKGLSKTVEDLDAWDWKETIPNICKEPDPDEILDFCTSSISDIKNIISKAKKVLKSI